MIIIKRVFKIILGVCTILFGIAIMPIPGPGGFPVVLAGLAILATEVPLAKSIFEKLKALKVHYFDRMSPRKKIAMVLASLALSAITTTSMILFFNDHPEIIVE